MPVILVPLILAMAFLACKQTLEYCQPLFFVGSRMTVAGLIFMAISCWRDNVRPLEIGGDFLRLCLIGLCSVYLANYLESLGIVHVSASMVAIVYGLSPLVSGVLSWTMGAGKLKPMGSLGIAIGMLGVLPLLLSEASSTGAVEGAVHNLTPELLVFLAMVLSVVGLILMQSSLQTRGTSPARANGVSMFIGGIMALAHSVCSEEWSPVPASNLAATIGWSAATLVLSNLLAYGYIAYVLKRHSSTYFCLAALSTPFFTAFLEWVLFGTAFSAALLLSAILIVIGGAVHQVGQLRKGPDYASKPS